MEEKTGKPGGPLQHKSASATTVIIHSVPKASVPVFLEWEEGIVGAASTFPGYLSAELYPPDDPAKGEWIVVIHFDTPASLQVWFDSQLRADWLARFPKEVGKFHIEVLPGGFGPWFATILRGRGKPVPPWKMAVTVLLGLYPTVMLVQILLVAHLEPLGRAATVLVGNTISVAILNWIVLPLAIRILTPWHQASSGQQWKGLFLILLTLAALLLTFRQIVD